MIEKTIKGCYICDFLIAIIDKNYSDRYTAYCTLHNKKIDDECDENALCNDFKNESFNKK